MLKTKIWIYTSSVESFSEASDSVRSTLEGLGNFEIEIGKEGVLPTGVVLLTADSGVDPARREFDQAQCVLFYFSERGNLNALDPLSREGFDGWWIAPLRGLDALGIFQTATRLRAFRMLSRQDSVASFTQDLTQDLERLSALQRSRFESRLEDFGFFRLKSRYVAGRRAGGNYFEAIPSDDGQNIHLVISDSSSYGLSAQMLQVVFRMGVQLAGKSYASPRTLVQGFRNELMGLLSPRDELSLFVATLSKRDLSLHYVCVGKGLCALRQIEGHWGLLTSQGEALSRSRFVVPENEEKVALKPGQRLFLATRGFQDVLREEDWKKGGLAEDSRDLLTELTYRVRRTAALAQEELPEQDCTGIVIDIDPDLCDLPLLRPKPSEKGYGENDESSFGLDWQIYA